MDDEEQEKEQECDKYIYYTLLPFPPVYEKMLISDGLASNLI